MPGHAAPGHMHAGRQMRLQAGPPPRRCASTPAWIQRCVWPPPHVLHAGPLARLYAKLGRVASTRARRCHVLGNRVDGRQATAPGTTKKEASWRFSRLQKQCLDLHTPKVRLHSSLGSPLYSVYLSVLHWIPLSCLILIDRVVLLTRREGGRQPWMFATFRSYPFLSLFLSPFSTGFLSDGQCSTRRYSALA
jgi:hypothetical protein